jgi:hypothetical protein
MPAFWLDMSQIATNHFLSSRWVPSIIVPAVTLNWREHFVHCHLWACPCTLEQVRFPHAGQTKPPGCLSSRSLLSHGSSSGYLSRNSRSVPLLSHSFLLSPPAWPFAIASSALPDASAVHPYDAAERRQEFLRLCRRSSAIYRYSKSVREDAKCVSAAERTPVNHCGEVLLGDFRAANEDERDMPDLYLFDLEDAIDSRAVENWFKEREVLQPIVELYSLMYSDRVIPSAALFLNLTQALEAFHSRMVCSDIKSYKVRVKVLVTSDKSATRGLNEFLCDAGQSKASHVYLKSRLSDLLYADGAWPIQIRKMSNANFVHGVIDTRNYLTHYDPKKELLSFTNDELKTVNMELLTLLEFHLMKAVGFDSTFAKEHVQRRLEFLLG